jgi:hypothetical protein
LKFTTTYLGVLPFFTTTDEPAQVQPIPTALLRKSRLQDFWAWGMAWALEPATATAPNVASALSAAATVTAFVRRMGVADMMCPF